MKLLLFVFAIIVLSCADYPELDLSIKNGKDIEDKRDGKKYKTVIIGEQEWMAKNLNYRGQSETDTIGRCYNNRPDNCETYGRLYTWAEAMGIDTIYNTTEYSIPKYSGICPQGSHLPSYAEWEKLLEYVGFNNALKLKTTFGWEKNNNNGTDEYGFSAMPAGCHYEGKFQRIGESVSWWSIQELSDSNVQSTEIYLNDNMKPVNFLKASWASIRCIKD
jgi:uncharacterized protein (TIGR02145 family)